MRLNRFIGQWNFNEKEICIDDVEIVNQIKKVLRLEIGENILLSDGAGKEASAKIISLQKEKIFCTISEVKNITPQNTKVNLFLAILKKENFEMAVQKAVECGVSKIIPMITERTIKTGLNFSRLQKIIREASEQCGQNFLPEILPALPLKNAITQTKNNKKIIFDSTGSPHLPINHSTGETCAVDIFIGPEGGFTEKEITLAKENNFFVASLGVLTLRAETAAIVGVYRAVNNV